jgi:hypothetical protein
MLVLVDDREVDVNEKLVSVSLCVQIIAFHFSYIKVKDKKASYRFSLTRNPFFRFLGLHQTATTSLFLLLKGTVGQKVSYSSIMFHYYNTCSAIFRNVQ